MGRKEEVELTCVAIGSSSLPNAEHFVIVSTSRPRVDFSIGPKSREGIPFNAISRDSTLTSFSTSVGEMTRIRLTNGTPRRAG